MLPEHVETLIVGGGQAGLTMSHMLSRRGCPHLVLERGRIGERWRSERWDGLRFQFPNWSVGLPDCPFRHAVPDGFATSAEIVAYLDAYAAVVKPPIRCGVAVTGLRREGSGKRFVAGTPAASITAKNVVIATGPYQRPVIPDLLARDFDFFQVHASAYRGPDQLPAGAVLVVGSGASGAQIAEELVRAGRRVYLSLGRHKRMPRRYRGHDLIWWLREMGLDQTPVEVRGQDATLPLITGAYGGHTIDFRELAAQGITLVGRLQSASEGILYFAADLGESLKYGDAAYIAFLQKVDAYIEQKKMGLPAEPEARAILPDPPCLLEPMRQLESRAVGLSSVIWATGYAFDFSWIDLPVLSARGEPMHEHGVAAVPGIYFLGLPWLSKMSSSFLSGVGDDAARLAEHIQAATELASCRGSVPGRTSLRTIALAGTAMVCFAANSILCRLALAPGLIDPATFTTLRVLSAALMLSLVVWLERRRLPRLAHANPLSVTALFAYLVFFSFAYMRLDAGSGALILIGAVQFSMFSIAFWEGERFKPAQSAGLGMALFGFIYLVLPGASAPDPFGAILMAISGTAWGWFSLLARGVDRPVEANASNLLCCLLPAVVVSLLGVHEFAATPIGLMLAAASGAIATGFGYVAWYLALRDLPAARAATVQLSMPALVALGGTTFLSEPPTMRLLIASVTMLTGVALVLGQRVEGSRP